MNLWLYSDNREQLKTSMSLVFFGAETLKDAKIIKRINELESKLVSLEQGKLPEKLEINDFIFSYLIDVIKITLFFENYFKAELIMNNFCVHRIKHTNIDFKKLSNQQRKRPIDLDEIHKIEPFTFNIKEKMITHNAIENYTLGFKNLISNENYTKYYSIDSNLLKFIKEINNHRNNLHFLTGLNFSISKEFIENIKNVNLFSQRIVNKYKNIYINVR